MYEEISALWSDLYEVFCQTSDPLRRTKLPKRYRHEDYLLNRASQDPNNAALAYAAAKRRNAFALQYLLKLGFSVDGGL